MKNLMVSIDESDYKKFGFESNPMFLLMNSKKK